MGCGNSKNKISSAATPRPPTDKPPAARKLRRANSKTVRVKPIQPTDTNVTNSDLEGDNIEVPAVRHAKKNKRQNKNRAWGSQDSLDSTGSAGQDDGREWSASSKFSSHSGDSGFGGAGDGGGLGSQVITEESNPDMVAGVEADFETPHGLDMSIVGNPVPQRYSAKDKDRMDEQRVIASLRAEGLIQRPMSRAGAGVSFEIVEQDSVANGMFGPGMNRPARLAKLEMRRKKTKRVLTQEEIEAKLERAEQRRKNAEEQRLAKISALNKSDVLSALDSFANSQKVKEEEVETKMDQATENREKKRKELRDKLKAKQEHAEAVRRRKKLAPINPMEGESPRVDTPLPRITEDTPVGGAARLQELRMSSSVDDRPVGMGGL